MDLGNRKKSSLTPVRGKKSIRTTSICSILLGLVVAIPVAPTVAVGDEPPRSRLIGGVTVVADTGLAAEVQAAAAGDEWLTNVYGNDVLVWDSTFDRVKDEHGISRGFVRDMVSMGLRDYDVPVQNSTSKVLLVPGA